MRRAGQARRGGGLLLAGLLLAALPAEPVNAQLIGGGLPTVGGGLPAGLPAPVDAGTAPVLKRAAGLADRAGATLTDLRAATVRQLLRQHRDVVEADDQGQPVVRGEILSIGATAQAVAQAKAAGFSVREGADFGGLGLSVQILSVPRGVSAPEALRRLRAIDPAGQYEFNHLYQAGGASGSAVAAGEDRAALSGRGLRIGMVDGAAAGSRPALASVRMVQQSFAPGGGKPSAHGTAVASLISGSGGGVRGSAPGATLYVADVYGTGPTGGSAQAVVQGLDWLARQGTPVINISLVGPQNLLLGAAVSRLVARGFLLVAAVGNDGPAAAPLYPAAYPGVIAVTGVDGRRRALPEAGRSGHVDFAAAGEGAASSPRGGTIRVRGTSFAAPVVAGRLARLAPAVSPAAAARAVAALAGQAIDLGAPGPDAVYGRGLVSP